MKKLLYLPVAIIFLVLMIAATRSVDDNPYHLTRGAAAVESISALSFGPDGILFIGDSKSAAVFAVDTKDKTVVEKPGALDIKNIDKKIAAVLGTQPENIQVTDIAVNPLSKKVYIAVQSADGTPVLLKMEGGQIQSVNLKDIAYSAISIANVPAVDAKDERGRMLRSQVISDLSYADGSVMLSGISNQEFGSTFRKIAFPFSDQQEQSSLEIFHAAHGRYETQAPIRKFTTAELNGKKYLIASYTCTPLVLFPMDELKPGKHVKGRTIGEFGAGNAPVDMVTLNKDGANYLFMANSNRPVMRVNYKNMETYEGSLTEPIKESYGTAGVTFTSLPAVNVLQMAKLDDAQVLVLQRMANGDLNLWTAKSDRWI